LCNVAIGSRRRRSRTDDGEDDDESYSGGRRPRFGSGFVSSRLPTGMRSIGVIGVVLNNDDDNGGRSENGRSNRNERN
jgi:hypothetical protein